ncbi:hypothetical protein RB598_003255 [Gaeumannomyces tritici]
MAAPVRAFGTVLNANRGSGCELSQSQRGAIVASVNAGKNYRAIASAMGISTGAVQSTMQRFKEHATLDSLPRSGTPSKLSPSDKRFLHTLVKRTPEIKYNQLVSECPVRREASTNTNLTANASRDVFLGVLAFRR